MKNHRKSLNPAKEPGPGANETRDQETWVMKKGVDGKGETWEKEEKSWTRFLGFSSPNLTTNCSRWAREQRERR